jgi:branched-chain amino acid transport system substrate-binding protein
MPKPNMKKGINFWLGLSLIGIILAIIIQSYRLNRTGGFKVGSILILSGQGASWGEAARNGILMAEDKINSQGGVNRKKLEVIFEDDNGDATKSVSAFNKLTAINHIRFIVGTSWSITGLPLTGLAKEKKVVMISPSLGVKDFNEANDYLFNVWPHDYILSENLAKYSYNRGFRKVAIFGAKDPWVLDQDKAFSNKFEELGGKVEFLFEPLTSDRDVRTNVLKVKNSGAIDAVILTTSSYDLTSITAKALRELGVNLPILSVSLNKTDIKNCGSACEGVTFLSFFTPQLWFEKAYVQRFGIQADIGADSAYDATMMLAEAINKTQSMNPEVAKDFLARIKTYEGASGNLISDGKRGFIKPYTVEQIKQGRAIPVNN